MNLFLVTGLLTAVVLLGMIRRLEKLEQKVRDLEWRMNDFPSRISD